MKYPRLLWVFLRLGIQFELQYRANFAIQLFQSLLGLATALAGLAVVFSHTARLGGWSEPQLLTVLGVYLLVGSAISMVIQPSMQRFMEDVRQGTLDYTLTKPADAQFTISVRQIQVWKVADVLLGLGVLAFALAHLTALAGIGQAVAFAITLLAGTIIVYSFWMILATLSFWIVRVDNILVIFQSMYEAGRWPVTIYPGALRWALTLLVPVAFAVTVPAEALTGRLTGQSLAGAIALAVALLIAARRFWRIGVRRYSGASA